MSTRNSLKNKNYILCGDALTILKKLPDNIVNCVVTSPPYWGLRDYGTAKWKGGNLKCDHSHIVGGFKKSGLNSPKNEKGELDDCGKVKYQYTRSYSEICVKCGARRIDLQLGLEKTPEEYVDKMVEIFREVKRVLRDDGTLWLNMGDSYATTPIGSFSGGGFKDKSALTGGRNLSGMKQGGKLDKLKGSGLKPKDLIGIPWRLAFALQANGWWLRQDIIWHKPNPMPESIRDRCTKSHEYIFLLSKSRKYYYDREAIREPVSPNWKHGKDASMSELGKHVLLEGRRDHQAKRVYTEAKGANRRSVWRIPTARYKEAHFATFPEALVRLCILAGCPDKCCPKCGSPWEKEIKKEYYNQHISQNEKYAKVKFGTNVTYGRGIVINKILGEHPICSCNLDPIPGTILDPFIGSGTIAIVAYELKRHFIGIELNPEYIKLIKKRFKNRKEKQ